MNWIGVQGGGGLQFFLDLQMMPVPVPFWNGGARDGSPLKYTEYKTNKVPISLSLCSTICSYLRKSRRPRL
jgi:hypothetical protein